MRSKLLKLVQYLELIIDRVDRKQKKALIVLYSGGPICQDFFFFFNNLVMADIWPPLGQNSSSSLGKG